MHSRIVNAFLRPAAPAAAVLAALAGCEGLDGPRGGAHGAPDRLEPAEVRPFDLPRVDAVLLLTGGTHGRLEVCNCPGPMAGALSRRSGMIFSYRRAFDPVVVLDSGDFFAIGGDDLRDPYLVKAYAAAGYDAVVLGANEWATLGGCLAPSLKAATFACLSTNASADRPRLPLTRELVRPAGRGRLAVISYLGPGALRFIPAALAPLRLEGPEAVARRAGRLKSRGCVVVLLAHVGADELADLAEVKGVDLIVRGHTTRPSATVGRVGDIPVLKVGGREHVGAAALHIADGRIAGLDFRLELVDTHWPLDRRVLDIYQAYAHEAMRQALRSERREGLRYVPSATCGRCHQGEHRAWRAGPHRNVWGVLVRAGRTGDPECLMCHTSGFGTQHGFRTPQTTPKLTGVNCQDCHRFNLEADHGRRAVPEVPEDTCTLCHTPANSPKFDFADYRAHVGCVRAGRH